ncbi:MAG: hypothetical protein AAGB46_06235 [Verrucomicrobiota bacterium]
MNPSTNTSNAALPAQHLDPATPAAENPDHKLWSKLPTILRWTGGISLLGSAFVFLLGGWMNSAPLFRYYSFFGLTAILSLGGLFCALKLKEDKGARSFFALTTAFIPVLFCQLGALIFAQVAGATSQFSQYFSIFEFDPIGASLLGATTAVSIILLTAFAFLGFSAMARPEAKRLTLVYLFANSLLLLPFRDENIVVTIGFILLASLTIIDRKIFSKQSGLRSWDGRAMRTLLFAPFGLLLLRTALLYSASGVVLSLFFASIAMLFFWALPQTSNNPSAKSLYEHFSLLPLIIAWFCLVGSFIKSAYFYEALTWMTIGALPLTLFIAILARFTQSSKRSFQIIAGMSAISVSTIQLLMTSGLLPAAIALATAITITILSFLIREKSLLYAGLLGTAASILYHIRYAVDLYQNNLWLSLAFTGFIVILAASYIERNWRKLIHQRRDLQSKLNDWN